MRKVTVDDFNASLMTMIGFRMSPFSKATEQFSSVTKPFDRRAAHNPPRYNDLFLNKHD